MTLADLAVSEEQEVVYVKGSKNALYDGLGGPLCRPYE